MENLHLTTNPEGFSTQNSPTVKDSVTKAQRINGGYDNSSPLKPVNTNYTYEASLISGKTKESSAPPGHHRYNTMTINQSNG